MLTHNTNYPDLPSSYDITNTHTYHKVSRRMAWRLA